jgi:hypothetical protein
VRGYDEEGCAPVHGRDEHGDYWRVSVPGVRALFEDNLLELIRIGEDPDPLWRGVLAHGYLT